MRCIPALQSYSLSMLEFFCFSGELTPSLTSAISFRYNSISFCSLRSASAVLSGRPPGTRVTP